MIVYGSTFSPFVRKVLAFAAEKDVVVEQKRIARADMDPDFRAASPLGRMPALRDGDFTLADSTAIAIYIEALHPDPALIPAEPRMRAMTIYWDEFGDTELFAAIGPMFLNRVVRPRFERTAGDDAAAARGEAALPPLLAHLEARMPDSGHLVGDRLTLADLAVASPLVNLDHLGRSLAAYPKVAAFADAVLARPSFADMVGRERAVLARA